MFRDQNVTEKMNKTKEFIFLAPSPISPLTIHGPHALQKPKEGPTLNNRVGPSLDSKHSYSSIYARLRSNSFPTELKMMPFKLGFLSCVSASW